MSNLLTDPFIHVQNFSPQYPSQNSIRYSKYGYQSMNSLTPYPPIIQMIYNQTHVVLLIFTPTFSH